MGVDLIYPTINLFQYSLREGLGDDDAIMSARSRGFYQKFLPDLKDLETYRSRERADLEFNELLYTDRSSPAVQSLTKPLDGFYHPIQLGDTYALQLNYSGEYVGDKPDRQPKDYQTAVRDLKLAKISPPLDGNSFGQTHLLTAFVKDSHVDKLEEIAKSCDRQITGKSDTELPRSISHGEWLGGKLFEFWTPLSSLQGNKDNDLQEMIGNHPHTIIWLFPIAKLNDIDEQIISDTCQDWIRLLHYRHKIFFAYYQSQLLKQALKSANIEIPKFANRLGTEKISLYHLQNLLLDTLKKFQPYSENTRNLADQQSTIEINRSNYQFRYEEMTGKDPNYPLQFSSEFETKYIDKYQRQIRADRAYFDPGLQELERLSQTIQGTIQIEQTKSDRANNLLIAAVGSGLAVSQVVSSIVMIQQPPDPNVPFYQTAVFQISLIPIGLFIVISLLWNKLRK